MTEETVVTEGTPAAETPPEQPTAAAAGAETSAQLTAVLDETVGLLGALGRALVTAAQDVTQRLLLPVDAETRQQLDLLVTAGVSKSRTEAAGMLIAEGLKAKAPLFERIERTQVQIAALKEQLRAFKGFGATS